MLGVVKRKKAKAKKTLIILYQILFAIIKLNIFGLANPFAFLLSHVLPFSASFRFGSSLFTNQIASRLKFDVFVVLFLSTVLRWRQTKKKSKTASSVFIDHNRFGLPFPSAFSHSYPAIFELFFVFATKFAVLLSPALYHYKFWFCKKHLLSSRFTFCVYYSFRLITDDPITLKSSLMTIKDFNF